MIFIYVGMRLYQYSEDNFDCLKEVFAKTWKGVYIARGFNYSVNISENSDFGQNMTFFTYFIAFYLKYFFVGIHILNKKV